MNKLEITLKQHTPLIHFQHDQDGATLRASEVKPKLDRFIINEFSIYCEKCEKELCENDLKAITLLKDAFENKKPSPYNCSITVDKNKNKWYYFDNTKPRKNAYNKEVKTIKSKIKETFKIDNVEVFFDTPFFANRDKVKDKKWEDIRLGLLNTEEIILLFKSLNPNIIELLKKAVPIFLTLENFGNRQNKGFGSFMVKDELNEKEVIKIFKSKYKTVKKYNIKDSTDFGTIFSEINKAYKTLKNDQSKPNNVTIRNYYQKRQFEWEKKATSEYAKGCDVQLKENERYVRAILGLANLYDYPQLNSQIIISDLIKDVERFKSPIFFKVIDNSIFLVCNPVPQAILNKEFRFDNKKNNGFLDITTPNYFNEDDFLKLLNSSYKCNFLI